MIGSLTGLPEILSQNSLLMNVNGVGYRVSATSKLIEKISLSDKEVRIYIHTHVKEDALDLYGFLDKEELVIFELLIEVSGIGPKTAILVLEKGEKDIKNAIINSDVDFFTNIPRIGKKNAQRIIIELKAKVGSLSELDLSGATGGQTREIVDGLMAMGFRRQEVTQALKDLPENLLTTEEKIKYILKKLGK